MRFGSLFSGIGGLDLGLERAGMECAWQVEIDPFCRKVLAKHWPDVRKFGDIKELTGYELGPVDLICGGFPCQPVSYAGRRKGRDDERWLWPEFERILRLLQPRYALVENVPGLLTHGMGDVLGGLARCGFDAEWDLLPAAAVGAPHLRYRLFIVAHRQEESSRPDPNGLRPHRAEIHELREAELRDEQERESRSLGADVANPNTQPLRVRPRDMDGATAEREGQAPEWQRVRPNSVYGGARGRLEEFRETVGYRQWGVEPNVDRMAPRLSSRVDRLRGLGNAVVPQVAEFIGRRIMEVAA